MSECETVAMAKQLSGDCVTVARSDAVFPAISEFVKIRIGICNKCNKRTTFSLSAVLIPGGSGQYKKGAGGQPDWNLLFIWTPGQCGIHKGAKAWVGGEELRRNLNSMTTPLCRERERRVAVQQEWLASVQIDRSY